MPVLKLLAFAVLAKVRPMPLITADNLTHSINNHAILDHVSLTLNRGDFITIIGPNGAGKSTLLKCLVGIIKPKGGHVARSDGAKINYIPQKISPPTTLPLSTKGFICLNKSKTKAAMPLAEELSITPLLDTPIHSLSGGEWQRVLLARALMDNPDAIILDEPAQNLDISGQMQFYHYLNRIHQERGIAILMVSHDLHMVMASTQQVICLYHHICCSGAPQMVAQTPEFENLFGKDMASMMAIYQHHHDHKHGEHEHLGGCDDR